KIYHQFTLLFGVCGVYLDKLPDANNPTEYKNLVQRIAEREGMVTRVDHVIVVLASDLIDSAEFSGMSIVS
ncbi:MAG: hypothetical protein Q8R43_02495, partial [Alphaproteobacteria bacterium]|nr:hypothetical protein [Alphaproteobacteria bacterium]